MTEDVHDPIQIMIVKDMKSGEVVFCGSSEEFRDWEKSRSDRKGFIKPLIILLKPEEKPVSLLILDEAGLCRYSQQIVENGIDQQLMGGFLTAIRQFSDEVFSATLNRVDVGEYTLLMKPMGKFLVCYVCKEATENLENKLDILTFRLRQNGRIMFELHEANITGKCISPTAHILIQGAIKTALG